MKRPCLGLLLWAMPLAAQPARPAPAAAERERVFAQAAAQAEAEHPAEAERLLRSAAERFQSVEALLRLARLQSGRKDAAGALEALRRARALAPNSEEVLSAYAQVSLAVHTPVPAVLALEPLARMCPSVAQYHYLLGVALMQAGDMPAAIEPLRRAQQIEPDRVLTLIALGLALNGRKFYGDAKPYLLRALELEPDSAEALAALAESEEGLDELAQAEVHAQRALSSAAEHVTAQLVIGLVRMKQQRYADARDAFERAAAADPSSSKAHYQLSLAYARLGNETRSREHLERYRRAQQEIEERLARLRSETGLPSGAEGMRP